MKYAVSFCCCLLTTLVFSQYNWKLIKQKDSIAVYASSVPGSDFKSLKVECDLPGSFDDLVAVLNDVRHHKDWVYNNKTAYEVKRVSPYDFYYYSETSIPWPMSNRDVVLHLQIYRDSLGQSMKVIATGVNSYVEEKEDIVRVHRMAINWNVRRVAWNKMKVTYTFDADPGGHVPAWLANMFADKGPYETFKKLRERLYQAIGTAYSSVP